MLQGDSSDGEGEEGRGAEEEGNVDMQVTFDSGLETLGERLASKKGSKAAETLWQAYEKRRRCCPNPVAQYVTRAVPAIVCSGLAFHV